MADSPLTEDQSALAVYLARKIFECSTLAKKDEVKRLALRGAVNPNTKQERDFGGLCEEALVDVIRRALEERVP